MQLIALISSSLALIGVASAASAEETTRYATLELMSDNKCSVALGEVGVFDTDINECKTVPGGENVHSLEFRQQEGNCTLYTYTDVTCHLDGQVWDGATGNQCARGEKYYRSYKLVC